MKVINKHKKYWVLLILLSIIFLYSQCKTEENRPIIESISPNWTLAAKTVSITIKGENFDNNCKIVVNNKNIPTQFMNENELHGTIDKSITELSLTVAKKEIPIYIKKLINSSFIESNTQKIQIRHIPKCTPPKKFYEGNENKSIKEVNLLTEGKDYIVLLFSEEDNSTFKITKKFMISEDMGDSWKAPQEITGSLFIFNNKLYNISASGEIKKSDDKGKTWAIIGTKPNVSGNPLKEYLRWIGDSNFIYTHSVRKSYDSIFLKTYKSSDFGKSWELVSENILDFSDYYYESPLQPSGAFMNRNGAIRLEYTALYGREDVGFSQVSFDGGKTYKIAEKAFTYNGYGYLLDNNDLTGILQLWYTGFVMDEDFYYHYKVGTKYGYEADVRELIPSFEGNSPIARLDINMGNHYFLSRGNMMICSYNKGQNWTKPQEFLSSFPEGSKLFPFFSSTGDCFIIIITPDNNLLFSKSAE